MTVAGLGGLPLEEVPVRAWNARSTVLRLVAAMTGLTLVMTGCGSDDDTADSDAAVATESETAPSSPSSPATSTSSSAPPGEQEAEAVDAALVDFAIELDEDSFAAGTYEFAVTNEGDASHDFVVERDGEDVAATQVLQSGQSETLAVDLEPGTYVFYCSVGNHRGLGMEVTVEVA